MKAWQLKLLLIVPLKEIAADSTRQCERLAAETTPERDARFYSDERQTDGRESDARFECDRAGHGEQQTVQLLLHASFSAAFHPN